MTPDVSVVIPVFNRPPLVREAVDSVHPAAPELTIEVIVVDDASTDDTWDVVRQLPRVTALRMERNGGQGPARNRGLDAAAGTWVKFLDSDDVLRPGHLSREVEAARKTNADIVVSGWVESEPSGRAKEFVPPRFESIVDGVLAGLAVPTSAALYRRNASWRWDPSLRKLDDWDYFVQAALGATTITTVDGPAYEMRAHEGPRQTGVSLLVNAREQHRILHKIERRLADEGRLTDARRARLAQYFYKELRVLSLHDRDAFESAIAHVHELDPSFTPRDEERQWWMRAAARILGTRRAILLHSACKRMLKPRG